MFGKRKNSLERTDLKNLQFNFRSVAKKVLLLLPPHSKTLIIGLIALGVGAGINLLFPYLIRNIVNHQSGFFISRELGIAVISLIGLFAIQSIFFYIRHYCFYVVGHRVVANLRSELFKATIGKDVAFFDSAKTGDLLSRLSSDTEAVQRALTVNISVALRYIIQVIGGIALMCMISISLTFVIIFILPIIFVAGAIWGRKLGRYSKILQTQLGDAAVIAEEAIGNVRTVKIFAGDKYEANRYQHAIAETQITGIARTKIGAMFSSSMVFVMNSAIAFTIWFGARLVFESYLTIGDLTAFLLYCVIVAMSFGFLISVWDEFMQAIGAAVRIFDIIDLENTVTTPKSPLSPPHHTAGSVSFANVTFSYPSRRGNKALDDISFEIPAGSTFALVGPSGAGKSTVAKLIPRFYDPDSGEINYCGIPLKAIALEELRSEISIVPQSPEIFSVSIRENIRYGKLTATSVEIEEAARSAKIHDFISGLPQGYDTLVGDKGIRLSGGERQRIAIARAIIKDPKFLILDEATSSLDSESEHLVQLALEKLMKNRTCLIIAHRLSTVQHADQVLVIDEGRIRQSGTHRSLYETPGLYQSLVQYQLL